MDGGPPAPARRPSVGGPAAWIAAAMFACPGAARAGNTRSFFYGDEAATSAGAVGAVARGTDAVWYNPAGLGGLQRGRLELSGTAFMLRVEEIPGLFVTRLPSGTRSFDNEDYEFDAVPTSLVLVRNGTETVSWGVGVYVTESSATDIGNSFSTSEHFDGLVGDALYAQGIQVVGEDMLYNVGPAIGWQIVPELRVGVALFLLYWSGRYDVQSYVEIDGESASGSVSTFGAASQLVEAHWFGFRATGGLQWEFLPGWSTSLAVRSPAFGVYRWGDTSETSSFVMTGGDEPRTSLEHSERSLDVFTFQVLDAVEFALGVAWQGDGWWVGAEGSVAPPMRNTDYDIDHRLLWNVAAGGRFRITDRLTGGAGLFTDRTSEPPAESLGERHIDYYGATLGLEFRTSFALADRPEPDALVFATTAAFRYAAGVGNVGGLTLDPTSETSGAPSSIDVVFHEMALHVGSALQF